MSLLKLLRSTEFAQSRGFSPKVQRRGALLIISGYSMSLPVTNARADGSGPELASFYDRHMALRGGVAHGWQGQSQPVRLLAGVRQVGVSQTAWFARLDDGRLVRWTDDPLRAQTLMHGVIHFAAGESGWFAIDAGHQLWHAGAGAARVVATDVVQACIGDGADYYVRADGGLWVRGLAHRGQYGDGRLMESPQFTRTAGEAVAVKAHTGHAIFLRRDGAVLGTGGNRFGPLSTHGLGDKADRWGTIFDGARAIATGSRLSVAIRTDNSLWAWGAGFGVTPRRLLDGVVATAAGDTATLALATDGALWQWEGGNTPRRLSLP